MRVAIVGGGLAGLTAAHTLAAKGCKVALLEASARLGGQISTRRESPFIIELGAEGFPLRRRATRELCRELGLEHRLVTQQVQRSLAWRNGRLVELAPGEAAGLLGMAAASDDLGGGLMSLRGGLGELPEALRTHLDGVATVHTAAPVTGLTRAADEWLVEREQGGSVVADAVVLALPAFEVERLLAPLVGDDLDLKSLPHVASVTVTLAMARYEVDHPLDATGFVGENGSALRACSFSSSKFADRCPESWCLLRAFFRSGPRELLKPTDWWVAYAYDLLAPIVGFKEPVRMAWVSRWEQVFPHYPLDFSERVDTLRGRISDAGLKLELAGAAAGEGGVDGAVRSGRTAALRLLGSGF